MEVKICEYCAYPEREISIEDKVEHIETLIRDVSILQALKIIHGPEQGIVRYCEVGGLLHVGEDDPVWGKRIKETKQNA